MIYSEYPDFWYVLFVWTGYEKDALNRLAILFNEQQAKPFLPTVEKNFKKQGKTILEKQLMFPGYLFVETKREGGEFYDLVHPVIRLSPNIIRVLGKGGTESMMVTDGERKALETILGQKREIEISEGIIEGDHVKIIRGALKGFESQIIKVNRHKQEAVIELDILGAKRAVTVGLEIVEKV